MIQRKETSCQIDLSIIEQTNCESKYWLEVLHRVVAVTKFLATRGLRFFGRNETIEYCNNENFLGCIKLISMFDPFLANHLQKYGNPRSGKTSYLSSTTLNKFIDLMGNKVSSVIIEQIKEAKFFSIIVDSTPDLSHTDLLTIVIRYVSSDCEPVERFLSFIPIHGHSSEYLENTLINYIGSVGLDILDCSGQGCDNASNLAGKYTGLQARLKMLNPLADFVPCAAHSLNLVVMKAVECNGKMSDFFTFLQEMYNFFSASTHHWKLLSDKVNRKKQSLTLKSRSVTRWCANAAATKSLKENYKDIMQVLLDISLDLEESPSTSNEANSLHKKMQKFETGICATVWDSILQRIDSVNKNLQNPQLDLSVVPEYFQSLIEYINFVRDKYEEFEEKAYELVGHKDYSMKRKRKTPKSVYDGECTETLFNSRDSFKISCFYSACDILITYLTSQMSAYDGVLNKFSCLFAKDKQILYEKAKLLQNIYSDDLEDVFPDELIHVFPVLENNTSISEKLKKIHNFGVKDTFPNVESAFKLFLTLPLANCTGERSFSLLKRIKSPLRNKIADANLSTLAHLWSQP